jgi:hypothetical protein
MMLVTVCHETVTLSTVAGVMDGRSEHVSVAAILPEEDLSQALAAVHRAGFGHRARVVSGESGSRAARLDRLGLPPDISALARSRNDLAVLIIDAPHQAAAVTELLIGLGALKVERFRPASQVSTIMSFDPSRLQRRSASRRSRSGVPPAVAGPADTGASAD